MYASKLQVSHDARSCWHFGRYFLGEQRLKSGAPRLIRAEEANFSDPGKEGHSRRRIDRCGVFSYPCCNPLIFDSRTQLQEALS